MSDAPDPEPTTTDASEAPGLDVEAEQHRLDDLGHHIDEVRAKAEKDLAGGGNEEVFLEQFGAGADHPDAEPTP